MKTHVVITGASRGIGKALAEEMAGNGCVLHLSSRQIPETVTAFCREKGSKVHVYPFDISNTENIDGLATEILRNIEVFGTQSFMLVNNAGMLQPMGEIGRLKTDAYRMNLEVNFVAPILLTNALLSGLADTEISVRIVNITSGAAKNPYHGWSHYCSTKAGLDMFTRCLFEEKGDQIRVYGFNPGRTDTKMQDEIRAESPENFKYVQSFIDAHKKGALNSPEKVAACIKVVLTSDRFPNGSEVSMKDF
ncbi:MAG: SDR family NAD(P)-dependent oxidoreductase [Balneolales bacterium]|nr:SDR family NAD(P)-dependent oxidoreductase [Balneolales bacterium]